MPLPPAIMIQATASNAGKSLLASGLCRLLSRKGLHVAPFKAQNMSLNSWVTDDGGEIGIAQAMQAMACGLSPSPLMNPVLLKPLGCMGSQIILRGRPMGTMPYKDYISIKKNIWENVKNAYESLSLGRDVMILEGAGSPAEINLRRHDIVNMAMAKYAHAKVILAADIDRGGAFASLAGTMSLLSPGDRRHVAAFCLNKFRGDISLLDPALQKISRMWKRPFIGVVPFLPDLRMPEEDSFGLGDMLAREDPVACLDIAVIAYPGLSNMADWDALKREPGVRVSMVEKAEHLRDPHLIILPGSRNVPAALKYLHENGLADSIRAYAARGGNIAGICAGLLILGRELRDPLLLEGGGSHAGLALLPFASTLQAVKTLSKRKATALASLSGEDLPCAGYEIHHGKLEANQAQPVIMGENGEPLGWGWIAGANCLCRIWGAWLHGIFDSDAFRHALLGRIAAESGISLPPGRAYSIGEDLDRVADTLENCLDMARIMSWLEPDKLKETARKSFQHSGRRHSSREHILRFP